MERKEEGIIAVVTLKEDAHKIGGGRASVFFAEDEEEREYLTMLLSRITTATAHNLGNGVYILVKH